MNELLTCWPSGGWPRFACDALWQTTLIGLIAWIAVRFVARRPAVRAWVAIIGLASCLAVPVVSAGLRLCGYGLLSAPEHATANTTAIEQRSSPRAFDSWQSWGQHFPQSARLEERHVRPAWKPDRWWTVIGVAWAVSSLILAWRFVLSIASVWRLREAVLPCNEKQILDAARRAARRMGVSRVPVVLVSSWVTSPTIFAFAKPLLFIPPPGARPAGELDWFAVFCHELAHFRRRDGWGRLATELASVLLPWQPLLWLLRRTYYRACDEACDDWAIAAGANPLTFAATLTEWVPRQARVLASPMLGTSCLKCRIVRLLAIDDVPRFRTSLFCRWGTIAAAIVLVATVAAAQVRQVETSGSTRRPRVAISDAISDPEATDHEKALRRTGLKPYRLKPPDIINIEVRKLVPSTPYIVRIGDILKIQVEGLRGNGPVDGLYEVKLRGLVNIGFNTGRIRAVGMTVQELEGTIARRFRQLGERPNVSVELEQSAGERQIQGEHLLGPDGTVTLGTYGRVRLAGMTRDEATSALERHLADHFTSVELAVDLFAYNSRVYYVVTLSWDAAFRLFESGNEIAERVHVFRFPLTGNETVRDAIFQIKGLDHSSIERIWVARPTPDPGHGQVMPVDWKEIARNPSAKTNYRLLPGDRVFVFSAPVLELDRNRMEERYIGENIAGTFE